MPSFKNIFFILLLLLISCSNNDKEYFFKYANEQPESSIRSQSMLFFKNQLEKKTNGRIKVELFFSGVLGNERELMDLVATGVLQGTRGGFFADANPKFNIITLPFLVDGWDQALRLVNSSFMQKINIGARDRGFHIPATGISQGFRAHTNNVRPIRHPNDLKGLKMRVPMQEVYVHTALAFGANPQELPFIEVYHALQTGVVDGQDNAPSNIWDFKIFEVTDYLTISNYATGPDPFMVNLKWYESLPNDLKLIFDDSARETIAMSDQLNRKEESEFIEKLSQHLDVNYLTYDDLEPFRRAVAPVYRYFVDQGTFSFEDIDEARKEASKIIND